MLAFCVERNYESKNNNYNTTEMYRQSRTAHTGGTLPPSVRDRQRYRNIKKKTIVKGQKNEILTRQESRHSSRPYVFYFLPTAHFLKQFPTHIAHIAKAPHANATTKALSKSAILPTHKNFVLLLEF